MEKFFIKEIPQVLDLRPETERKPLTLETVEAIMACNDRAVVPIMVTAWRRMGL